MKILKTIKGSEKFSHDIFDSAYVMTLVLLAITISNLLGWIPVSMLGLKFIKLYLTKNNLKFFLGLISSFYELHISDKNYFLIICTILPVNSLFNPIFYGIYDLRTYKIKQQNKLKSERLLISISKEKLFSLS